MNDVAAPRKFILSDDLRPQEPIPRSHYATIVAASLGALLALWALLSYGGFVRPSYFLPTPSEVVTAGLRMIFKLRSTSRSGQ